MFRVFLLVAILFTAVIPSWGMYVSSPLPGGTSILLAMHWSATPQAVDLYVNGVLGGNAAVGTATQTCSGCDASHFQYTAPSPTSALAVTITVKKQGTSTVYAIYGFDVRATAPPGPQPVASVGLDGDGNLLVNGAPFLYIGGQKTDYFWWSAAGYSTAQADAKLGAMQAAGFNGTGEGNWGQYNGAYQDLLLWQKFGFYWLGSATLDDQGHSANGWTDAATLTTIVKEFSLRPNLLRWYVAAELNPQVAVTAPYDLASYQAAVTAIRAADPVHQVVGDLTVFDTNYDTFLVASADQFPLAEMTVTIPDGGGTGIDAQHIMDVIFAMQNDWNRGQRFIAGLSITPIGEEDNLLPSTFVGPSQASLTRALVWAVAANVKAFELLWGPNQRGYCLANPTKCVGDTDQSASVLRVWADALAAFSQVRALQPVILAPGRFAPITTTPAFQVAQSGCNNIRPIYGVYAAKKQVGAVAYVIAVNVNEVGCSGAYPQGYNDTPVSGATIDVGFPITSVARMLDTTPAPAFSGSVISDNFGAMGVHVYRVQ